jgi:hypothetical protein
MSLLATRARPVYQRPLDWAAPALTSPTTYDMTVNPTVTVPTGTDAIIQLPTAADFTTSGGIVITGGRNIVLIGGRIVLGGTPNGLASRATYFKDQDANAQIHVEGLWVGGSGLSDFMTVQQINPGVTLTVQNCWIDDLHAQDETGFTAEHPDWIQVWTGVENLRISRMSGYTPYQALMLQPYSQAATIATVTQTGAAFTLTIDPANSAAVTTASIATTSTAATVQTRIQTALRTLVAAEPGGLDVTVTGATGGPWTVSLWPPLSPATITAASGGATVNVTQTGWTRAMGNIDIRNVSVSPSTRVGATGEIFYQAQHPTGTHAARNIFCHSGTKTKDEMRQDPTSGAGTQYWASLIDAKDYGGAYGTSRDRPVPVIGHFVDPARVGLGYVTPGTTAAATTYFDDTAFDTAAFA